MYVYYSYLLMYQSWPQDKSDNQPVAVQYSNDDLGNVQFSALTSNVKSIWVPACQSKQSRGFFTQHVEVFIAQIILNVLAKDRISV